MASLPAPEEVAGPFLTQYEVYYKRLDPAGKNEIGAMDAATFLKKSALSDDILGKIWDMSDPDGKGSLDKRGFFCACKLVALVQDRQDLLACNLKNDSPAPNFGDATAPGAPTAKPIQKGPVKGNVNFLVKPEEKRKYDALFDQLQPVEGKLPGDKVRQVMMGSKLPMPVLGKVWDLSDIDRDGMLDRYEFTVAMHLVYRNLQGDPVPDVLPVELTPQKVPGALSQMPNINGSVPKPASQQPTVEAVPWVINAGERLRYSALFRQTDSDKDGFVSGVEIKNVFLQTGLPQNILAHIWNLCDMKQEGKLNPEQFALAMWLIQRRQAGKDPPAALTPDMVPPSMRPKGQDAGLGSIYNNPELEMIAKEIQAMLSEKLQIEREVQEVEYQISVKNTEGHSLQSEYDTLAATLKQLTNQRDVAQKRLDDLDGQKSGLLEESKKMDERIEDQIREIEKLRTQSDEQEETLVKQEEEVHGKKRAYEKLKEEEKELRQEIKKTEMEIQRIEQDIRLGSELEEEAKEKLEILQEAEKHMIEGNKVFESASEDCSNVQDTFLEPLRLNLELPDYSRLEEQHNKPKKPPVPAAPVGMNGYNSSGFDGYGQQQSNEWVSNDAFGSSAFDDNRSAASAAFDPFGMAKDPFAPVATTTTNNNFQGNNHSNSFFDPFGFASNFNNNSKPFNALSPAFDSGDDHPPVVAPRPDSGDGFESPTPALPPKNNVPAPKRPPPPRRPPPPGGPSRGGPAPPVPPPPNMSPDDPFGAPTNSEGGGGFADFANFSSETNSSSNFFSNNMDSAFTSPTRHFNFPRSSSPPLSGSDSAFCSKDPTPTHTQQQKLEFQEDPFQNHRYGDPFELSSADPFKDKEDPFTAPVSAAFGNFDAFSAAAANNASSEADPFSLTLKNSLVKNNNNSSPFDDAFGGNSSRSKDDWFSAPRPKVDGVVPKISSRGINSSQSLATNWGPSNDPFSPHRSSALQQQRVMLGSNPDPFSGVPKIKGSKASHMSSDFLTGSPMKDATPVKEKKKRNWVPKLKASDKGSSSSKSSPSSAAQQLDDVQLRMAAEASKRAEEDRRKRMQLQEEQDLAYAIALSKAEAASLKTS